MRTKGRSDSEFMERYYNEVDDVMYMMCYTNMADKRVAENLRRASFSCFDADSCLCVAAYLLNLL